MDIKKFNELFYVNVITVAVQSVDNITDTDGNIEFHYGKVDEFLRNENYKVFDRKTNECVFGTQAETDDEFLFAVEPWFNNYIRVTGESS